ncbi:MAG: hypothetical protein F6K48_27895 [Okeania sp. SIO3H1]|nr:hypothetical protein [Okeania sp. SIO3H1]
MTTYIPNYNQNIHLCLSKVDLHKSKHSFLNPNEEDFYFQILVNDGKNDFFKLLYGTKKQLKEYLNLKKIDLPTIGAPVNENFANTPINSVFAPQNDECAAKNLSQNENKSVIQNSIETARYTTVRSLLQSRKLSQVITSTWLAQKDRKTELTKKIFDTCPTLPENVWILGADKQCHDSHIKESVDKIEEQKELSSFIIRRDSTSYQSICLALLLAGQAYYKNGDKYELICDSIVSTYEIIWEFGFGLSWDDFYGSRRDVAEPGLNPAPPYNTITLPYPPKPDKDSLEQKNIEEWARAKDLVDRGEFDRAWSGDPQYKNYKYPFYPLWNPSEQKWVGDELKFIAPAYPYIALTSI